MSQQPYPPASPDDAGAAYPPTSREWAQPVPDFSSDQPTIGLPPATPTYSPYPGQPSTPPTSGSAGQLPYDQPSPYGQHPPYDQPSPYGKQNPYAQQTPYGQQTPYSQQTPYGQPSAYGQQNPWQHPPTPPYDSRSGPYVQQSYGQPVIYQTVVNNPVPMMAPKSIGLAYVLWFFLGALGVHHFYLGRNGWGVAYLLCTVLLGWIGIGLIVVGIGLLIDLFLIPSYTRTANQRLTGYRFL